MSGVSEILDVLEHLPSIGVLNIVATSHTALGVVLCILSAKGNLLSVVSRCPVFHASALLANIDIAESTPVFDTRSTTMRSAFLGLQPLLELLSVAGGISFSDVTRGD